MRALLDVLLPSSCAGCGRAGSVWCTECAAAVGAPRRVPAGPGLPAVYALGRYRGPLRAALLAYKERGRRELAAPLGRALADGLLALGVPADGPCLVPVPSRAAAARSRGGDHVLRLARSSAAELAARGVPAAVTPGLRLARGVRDSVGLGPAARAANLAGRVLCRPAGLPPVGSDVVLLDDVATTGATIATATAALTAAGIQVRAALVIAMAAPLLQPGGVQHRCVTGTGPACCAGAVTA